jgi:hypothetical protein
MTRKKLSSSVKKKLRDPIWQSIGVFLAFISLLTTILISSLLSSPSQQSPKRIVISSQTSQNLTDFPEPVSQRTRVLIDNKEERDLRLFVFYIEYKGNEPVRPSDFDIPLRGRIPSNRKLVGVQKSSNVEAPLRFDKEKGRLDRTDQPPINFEVEVLDEHTFQIKPLLMNPREWLAIEIYTAATKDSPLSPNTAGEKYEALSKEVNWSCHVAGVQCPSPLDFDLDLGNVWGVNDPWYLQVYIMHTGRSVYSILFFSIVSLLMMVLLAKASGLQKASPIIQIVLFSIGIASSIASAEVISQWLFPEWFDLGQPVYAWVIFWSNLSIIIVLALVAIWKRKSQKARVRRTVQQDAAVES